MTFQTSVFSVWRGASTQPCPLNDCFALLLNPFSFTVGHFLWFLGQLASFREWVFKSRHWKLFMSYFFSFEKHSLVNNACSSHKGHCWQGARRLSGLWTCTDLCISSNIWHTYQKEGQTSDYLRPDCRHLNESREKTRQWFNIRRIRTIKYLNESGSSLGRNPSFSDALTISVMAT